jgi:hypothetical protein
MRNGNSFTTGMNMAMNAWDQSEQSARQKVIDAQNAWRFAQEQARAQREGANRADLDYIAKRGDTGITPNMTTAGPSGMGPVADPRDVGLAAPMTDAEQQSAIGRVALRNGDVTGFNSARDRGRKLTKEASMDAFGKKLLSTSDEDLIKEFQPVFQKFNDSAHPVMFGWDDKAKRAVITTGGGDVTSMNSAELRAALLAAHQMGNGDVEAGVAGMLGLEKTKDDRVNAASDRSRTTAGFLAGDYRAGEHLKLDEKRTNASVAASNATAAHASMGTPMTFLNDKGEPVIGFMRPGPGGKATFQPADMPTGLKTLRAPRPEITNADVLKGAQMLIDSGPNPTTGKPWAVPDAMAEARRSLSSGNSGAGVDVDLSALAAALKGSRPPATGKGTPAGLMGPQMPPTFDPFAPYRQAAAAGNKEAQAFLQAHDPSYAPMRDPNQDMQDALRYVNGR